MPELKPPRDANSVVLTFDDGPDLKTTPRLLETLAQHQIQAMFFVIGTASRLPGAGPSSVGFTLKDTSLGTTPIPTHRGSRSCPWNTFDLSFSELTI